MPGIEGTSQQYDPELLKLIFGAQETTPDEIEQQRLMANMLGARATNRQNPGPSAVGGIASGVAQGMQGMMAGSRQLEAAKAAKGLSARNSAMRLGYVKSMFPDQFPKSEEDLLGGMTAYE